MKMFKMMAASMLGVALCLGFTACSDDDENENGEGGEKHRHCGQSFASVYGRASEVGFGHGDFSQ